MQYNDISYGGDSVADNMTKEERGKQMALVKNKNTKPEVDSSICFGILAIIIGMLTGINFPENPIWFL